VTLGSSGTVGWRLETRLKDRASTVGPAGSFGETGLKSLRDGRGDDLISERVEMAVYIVIMFTIM
jgi:hypothetical protein